MKVIQVGMGRWGRNWYRTHLSDFRGLTVAAIVDQSAETLEQSRSELGIQKVSCFTSLSEALGSVSADAVIVTAALTGHVPICREALGAGLHVLTEKPFAPRIRDAKALVKLSEERQRVLMVSQNYRYYPAVRTVQSLLNAGTFGDPHAISLDFRKFANTAPKEGHKHYHIDHPLLMDMAIHHFDLLRLICGTEPIEVFCQGINPSWSKFDDPPAVFGMIKFPGDLVVSYRGSWISHRSDTSWAGTWSIECEKGEISWESRGTEDALADRVTVTKLGKDSKEVTLKKVKHLDRSGALDAFARAIRTGEEPETSGADNIGTLELMFAMRRSVEFEKPVKLG